MGWIRTRFVAGYWLWRKATDDEMAAAKAAGVPVHKLFGEQPSEYDK